jgi:hypothetical protein
MLFQPAIIALLLASCVCVRRCSPRALRRSQVIRHWDIRSGSERQLRSNAAPTCCRRC